MSFAKRYVIPCIVQCLQAIFLWSVLAYITIYWIDSGFSHFEVGILVAVFPLTSLICMVPFGMFVDRLSPKKLAIASYVVFAASIAGLMAVHDFWPTFLVLAIGGIGNALFSNSLPALFYKTMGDKFRGFKLGTFNAAMLVGYGLGPLLGGYIYSAFDMNAVFTLSLLGLVPLLVVSTFMLDASGTVVKLSDYRADLSTKSALVFIILIFVYALHSGVEQTSFSLLLNKDLGIDKSGIGWMVFIYYMFMAILSLFSGFLGDRLNAKGRNLSLPLYAGILISGLTNIALLFSSDFGGVLATRLSHALGHSLTSVTRNLIASNLFVSKRMGGNLGVIAATGTLALLAGAMIGAPCPDTSMAS
jgi:MFS transporter, DHA1 family, multidrug resistance protein